MQNIKVGKVPPTGISDRSIVDNLRIGKTMPFHDLKYGVAREATQEGLVNFSFITMGVDLCKFEKGESEVKAKRRHNGSD